MELLAPKKKYYLLVIIDKNLFDYIKAFDYLKAFDDIKTFDDLKVFDNKT